jgi:misacylated tRNA(Ala) deacylase
MTELLFRDDAYLAACEATVVGVNERGGILLDCTVFYPTGGGQPGDSGRLAWDGGSTAIATAVKGESADEVVHVPAEGETAPPVGTRVTAEIDWDRRYAHMRVHTALHLLSAVLPFPVTGGQISDGKGRLDFDIPEMSMAKEEIDARLNELVAADHVVTPTWITDEELDAKPDLVKTMSVQPPRGAGRVRLIEVAGCDLQPCGGTHVRRTGEIGRLAVGKIEKKGRQNRRVSIQLA